MSNTKRMIMAVGDSRVGKSTVIKLLIELLLSHNKVIKVYNHDNRNKLKAYESLVPIEKLIFFSSNPDSTDLVLEDLNNKSLDTILVDMPGQYIEEICQYIDNADFFQMLALQQWKLTFLQPISHRPDCIEYLKYLLEFATDNANYMIVKNQYFDTRFREYNKSMHQKMSLIGGAEIELPALHRDHYQAMEALAKPYSLCHKDQSLFVVYRTYIYHWINNFFSNIKNNQLVSEYLGIVSDENRRDTARLF